MGLITPAYQKNLDLEAMSKRTETLVHFPHEETMTKKIVLVLAMLSCLALAGTAQAQAPAPEPAAAAPAAPAPAAGGDHRCRFESRRESPPTGRTAIRTDR